MARVKGQIVAARVQGHVDYITTSDGQSHVLHEGNRISDRTRIETAAGASVILVFSNGATVDLSGDSVLDVEKFEQDPFSQDLKPADMTREIGTSETRLNLTRGELVGKVVHLNVDRGSEFEVQTPVGAAGIRGTTFRIVFRPGPHGTTLFSITTQEGVVVYRGVTSGPIPIPAGKQVVATFTLSPPTPGGGTGGGTTPAYTTTATVTTTDTSPAEEAEISAIISQAVPAASTVTFASGTGSGPPPSNPDSTPSGATQPNPNTSPLTGGSG
ncbi:MAG TPA: FecR domain-containing protein [Opitutaceae bacterium]